MSKVTIIGTGNMGQAIASVVARSGHETEVLGRTDSTKPVTGEIVILAVPHAALSAIVAERGAELAGRVVVDITNPVNFETFDGLVVDADSSATAGLAAALPHSKVVKAFNTNFASTLASGKVGDLTTTVLVAGDDAEAKQSLAAVVTAGGLNAVDAGSLKRARELEAAAFLQIGLAAGEKIGWTGGFGLVA